MTDYVVSVVTFPLPKITWQQMESFKYICLWMCRVKITNVLVWHSRGLEIPKGFLKRFHEFFFMQSRKHYTQGKSKHTPDPDCGLPSFGWKTGPNHYPSTTLLHNTVTVHTSLMYNCPYGCIRTLTITWTGYTQVTCMKVVDHSVKNAHSHIRIVKAAGLSRWNKT